MIKAYWYKGDGNNFGDVITPIILQKISNQRIEYSIEKYSFCSIGSVAYFDFRYPMTFWGSGIISKESKSSLVKEHNFLSVRGPKTREKIIQDGGECPEVYGDPALLLPFLYPTELFKKQQKKITILPHWIDYAHVKKFKNVCDPSICLVDIRKDVFSTINSILNSQFLITSSLHGLIVGEAYGIPTLFVQFGNRLVGNLFKFEDYFQSTGRDLQYIDNKNKDFINFSLIDKTLANTKNLNFNCKPLIKSFPYTIKNKNLIQYLNLKEKL